MPEPTSIAFAVRGLPVAQGTARAFVAGGRARIATDANKTNTPLGAWRTAIRTESAAAMGDAPPTRRPVSLTIAWSFPRPASHYLPANSRRPEPELRLDAPTWMTSKPDIDKLERALLDGMTAVVYVDDDQVAAVRKTKRYAMPGEPPGVRVWVTELAER